jgi:RIP metalloprotease RseP
VGDVITAIDGESLPAAGRSVNDVVAKVKAAGSNPVRLKIDRQNAPPVDIEVVPKTGVNGEGRIGVQLEANAEVRKRIASDPAEGLFLASKEFGRLTGLVCKSLFSLVSNFSQAKDNVSGPIAIVGVGAEVMRGADASGLYQFASVININLAVVNILPLPALDGGFLLLIVIEALRGGKKLPAEVEQSITASGVLLLLGSGMFLILRDTLNLVGNLGQH